MATTLKEAALHYQEMGLRIFPLIPLSKRPMAVDSEGYRAMMNAKERCLTKIEVERLWSLYPDANIGEFPGRGSGDSDNREMSNSRGSIPANSYSLNPTFATYNFEGGKST